jgi:hypothetical protein
MDGGQPLTSWSFLDPSEHLLRKAPTGDGRDKLSEIRMMPAISRYSYALFRNYMELHSLKKIAQR